VVASIADVAALAGVSRTTVSHTISGKRAVGAEVRQRVEAAMAELGYVPRRSAQSLALGRTQLIGLLVPDIANGFFAELAKAVESSAIAAGYNVILGNTGFDSERELVYLQMVRSRAVDGILYATGAALEPAQLEEIINDVPLVLVDEELQGDSLVPKVVSDNFGGGSQAAECLLRLGHRHALVISASERLRSSAHRVEGFTHTWSSCEGTTVEVVPGDFTLDGGAAGVARFEKALQAGRITAIFAVNDLVALGAIRALRALGIDVPRDVSVIGFDDSPIAQHVSPGLTTVRQDARALGSRATAVLMQALGASGDTGADDGSDAGGPPDVVSVELIIRGTTGPARTQRVR
jgi:DNA-binding LacI/PurR family transcriptional regulator